MPAYSSKQSTIAFKLIIFLGFLGLGGLLFLGDFIGDNRQMNSVQFQSMEMQHEQIMLELNQNREIMNDDTICTVQVLDEKSGRVYTFTGTNRENAQAMLDHENFRTLKKEHLKDLINAQRKSRQEIGILNQQIAHVTALQSQNEHVIAQAVTGSMANVRGACDSKDKREQLSKNQVTIVKKGTEAQLTSIERNLRREAQNVVAASKRIHSKPDSLASPE